MEFLKNVKFIRSVFNKKDILNDLPAIAMVGKSNVGKSSFINSLTNNKNTAKVGSTPGKTRCVNFFDVNNEFYLVDLPGYGYSKMSDSERRNINELTNYYLERTSNLKHVFFILDIRHKPTIEDKQMYNWLSTSGLEFTIILNKADKLSKKAQEDNLKLIEKELFAKENILVFSAETKLNLEQIIQIIKEMV